MVEINIRVSFISFIHKGQQEIDFEYLTTFSQLLDNEEWVLRNRDTLWLITDVNIDSLDCQTYEIANFNYYKTCKESAFFEESKCHSMKGYYSDLENRTDQNFKLNEFELAGSHIVFIDSNDFLRNLKRGRTLIKFSPPFYFNENELGYFIKRFSIRNESTIHVKVVNISHSTANRKT